jgi:hypothetical protein
MNHRLRARSQVWMGLAEKRVDQVDYSDSAVDSGVHVLPKRVAAVCRVAESGFACCDAPFQRMLDDRLQEGPLIGKVSIKRSDANPGMRCERVPRGFASHFEHQLDGGVEQAFSIS